jgi:very-short-patch-repair endonuclease
MTTDHLVAQYLEKLRLRLLDLSGRNRLLNFKFSERSRTQVRLVDELPDQVFEKLERGTALTIASLAEPPEHPRDEDDDAFRLLLEAMRDADEEYMAAVASLDEADRDSEEFQRIERELRDKVRDELGMPTRTDVKSLSKTDYAKTFGINPDYDLPTLQSEDGGKPAHRDNNLQTLLYPNELERKLAGLREGARKSIQETGLNTLYLAFGMLEWYESDQSDKRLLAPLLLYPVTLERQLRGGQYYYTVKSFSEEPEENFSLRERLRQDYGIVLPAFTHLVDVDGQAADTPEFYFEKVKHVIRDRSRWKIRRFLTLSLFSFGGIALFQDLNPERWSDKASILKHPLVSSILCGQEEVSQDAIAPDYEVDHPTVANKVPLLITDADASQFSAIVDAIDGKNSVIEGPPGTGKSQTITNLIAAALAKGKKVLFVAEKKAALEVVYNRLADAGLENYCLEVHSTATSRQSFYERLKQRVEQGSPVDVSRELGDQVKECSQLKQLLSRYVLLLNQSFGRIGKTIQELLWCAQRANDLVAEIPLPSTLSSLRDDQAISMTAADFQRKCQHLKEFRQQHQELLQKYSKVENHPWFGLTAHDLSPIDQGDLLGSAKMWSSVLKQLQTSSQQAAEMLAVNQQSTLAELTQFQQQLGRCPEISPLIEAALLPVLKTAKAQDSVTTLVHQLKKYRKSKESLKQYFQDEMVSLPDLGQLKSLLTKLQTIEVHGDKEYVIANLRDLSEQTAEVSKKLEQYKPIVTQVASFFDLSFSLSATDIGAISTAVKILTEQSPDTLSKRTAELCNPSNHEILAKAQVTCEKLRALRDELKHKYYIDACESSERMYFYANKLRHANFFTHWFDSEYHKAKKLWTKIQKQSTNLSDSEIAGTFEKIARFQEQLNSFSKDSTLRRICGQYFRELETDFNSLLSVNSFATNASQRLASCSQGQYLARFLIQADITKLEKVSRLQNSQKFQSLMTFVNSLKLEEEFNEQQNWEELAAYYRTTSSASIQIYEELTSFSLRPLMPISAISNLIQGIENLNSEKQKIAASEAINTLGYFYQEERTDIERLEATTNFAKSVIQSQLPQSVQDKLFTIDTARVVEVIQAASRSLSSCLEKEAQYRQAFFQQGKPDAQAMFGSQYVANLRPEQIAERLDRAVAASDDLPAWVNYHRAYQQVTDDGMQSLVQAFEHEKLALENLEDVYQVVFYRSLLRFAYQQHPELNQLSGINQAQAREQFQRADKQLLSLYQKQLVAQLAQAPIEPGNSRGRRSEWTNLALIQNEINKQKRHISQRDLFQRASVALQQLKPCWMMSPASVAQFIPPGAVAFDMVIIDEASQMRPEEALGSIARAKQLVVVGDPKQLPPTDFFKARFDQDVEEDSGEEADILDDESILDMSLKVFYPARRLKWHYRSRHESLIAFSNQHFYDNSLTIFPSPNNQFAVEYQYIETGAYRSGANVPEAMRVAEAAADFMRQYPHLSLGIVTLNQKQQELLLDEMDRLFALHPELEQYRVARENTLEPFFVKNLENVQGDERDVIFISTVYGPERPGMPVMQRFGPINSRNGHRRLNVLFTRAKERVVVFSSMKSSDIRPSPTSNRGVQVLKEYLEYAQTQRLQTAVVTGREPDSDFEIFVAERVRQQGYEVVLQVGVSGYFIDLAVVDPERQGTYLLGIECDGATYHSSKAARDRDRLRQQVLERLGWKLYRIWSTDWFKNSTTEVEKLMRYLRTLGG